MAKTNKGRKLFATTATAALVASAIVPVASAAQINDFNTISSYAQEAVQDLVDRGVIQGDEKGNFNPRKSVTRAEAATILVNALELESTGSINFTDVKAGAWYYDAINAAVNNGIFQGQGAGKFNPSGNLTRSEAAIILVDAFGLEGSASLSQFSDSASVKAWAQEALEIAVANGVIKGDNGKLNPNAPITRQDFAVMYSRTEGVEAPVSGAIKAINNTTVEVTFEETVADIKALDFAIEGLEISNAVVKQTDKATVVLTTSAQTADKEYTLTVNGEAVGKFKGVSAVVPTAVKMLTPSVQGTIGKEVTVKAQVEVPTGQSKAGIPVTFNIVNGTVNQLNEKIEVVAYTNEEGVASHSYTRYYKYDDNVTAYASQKSSVFASGKVYWAQGLTVTEVTSGNTLANGSKKVYKIKTDTTVTETFGTAATSDDYNYVNVAFLENVNVAPDKLVRGVKVIDTGLTTNADYPSQVTTGGVQVVRVKVNAAGEGSFTLTGDNGTVTPVVFVDESTNRVGKYTETALQSAAPAVKFELSHTLGLTVKAEGVQNAAAINVANANNKGTGEGGRDYTVTITDKNGKVAPAGTVAYVTFESGNYSTDKKAYILDADGNRVEIKKGMTAQPIKVAGTKGEATFTLVGQQDAFAAPTVYLENGKEAGLDKSDLQMIGETTYFVDAVINNASLTVRNADGKAVETLPSSQSAFFHYNSVDQNGFDYYAGTGSYEVSYQVTAHFADVTVYGSPFGSKVVKKGTTETVKVNAVAGKAKLEVRSENVASNVTVEASASLVSLPNQTATIEFTKGTQVPNVYTGNVESIDKVNNRLKFVGFDAITYSTGSFKNEAGVVISEDAFEKAVSEALAATAPTQTVKVTSVKNTDGTYTLEIESITGNVAGTGTITNAVLSVDGTKLTLTFDKNVEASSIANTDFTLSTGSAPTVASVSGSTVVLNVVGVSAADTVGVLADKITFTDGTSNAVIAPFTIVANPAASKISTLGVTTKNQSLVAQVDAKGSVAVSTKTIKAIVKTAEAKQAAYNGLKLTFVQDGTSSADPAATYNGTDREITVKLGVTDANNTLAKINAAIAAATPAVHGDVTVANVELDAASDVPTFDDVATPVTVSLTGGVTAVSPAQAGVYTFTINTNLVFGDKITLNGKSYVAGADFVIGSTADVTAANLAAKIATTDARFASATAVSTNTITLTDAVINDAAAPALKWN